jgi:hypothetical protein
MAREAKTRDEEEFGAKPNKGSAPSVGLLESRIRDRARSSLKAQISEAAAPLRALAGAKVGPLYREVSQSLDKVESTIYQAQVEDAEKNAVIRFIDRAEEITAAVEAMNKS